MNLKAFPFFESLSQMQEATKHGEALLCPVTRLLPFQIAKPRDNQPIDCINVYRGNGSLYRTIMGNEIRYDYHQTADTDFITYYGATLKQPLHCGTYYLEISGRFSALFRTVNSVEGLVRLEWAHASNLTDTEGKPLVLYQTGFVQRLYLATEITQPSYPYEETGDENEFKEFFADFRRVTKQSQFQTLLLPPYLADALGALPLHGTVHIGPYQHVKGVEVSPEWLDFTAASVTVKFSESTPVIAMGCARPLELETIDTASYTPRGYLCGQPDTNAYWEPTGVVSCEQVNGQNTGYTLIEQQDRNPASATYNQKRMVRGILNTTACPVPVTYYSAEQSEYVQKNDCGLSQTGSTVLVKVPAGAFTSTVSQLEANNKALAHLNAIKQAEANERGTCQAAAILKHVDRLSSRYSTPLQACAAFEYPVSVYSQSGSYYDRLYTDSAGTTLLPDGYYQRVSDFVTMQVVAGDVMGVYSCGGDREQPGER